MDSARNSQTKGEKVSSCKIPQAHQGREKGQEEFFQLEECFLNLGQKTFIEYKFFECPRCQSMIKTIFDEPYCRECCWDYLTDPTTKLKTTYNKGLSK